MHRTEYLQQCLCLVEVYLICEVPDTRAVFRIWDHNIGKHVESRSLLGDQQTTKA